MKGLTSPEGIIMLMVAAILDITGFIIFLLGTWFGIDDYGILEVIATVIIGVWMFIRYSSLGSEGQSGQAPEAMPNTKESEPTQKEQLSGSANKDDWEQKNGVWQLKKGKGATSKSAPKSSATMDAVKDIAKGNIKSAGKKAAKRYFWTLLIEAIPILGGALPTWTIFVYREMNKK